MNNVKSVFNIFEFLPYTHRKDVLLYGDTSLDNNQNKFTLKATLTYIEVSQRFTGSIFD